MPVYQNVDELRAKYSPIKTIPNFTLEGRHFKYAGTTANGVLRTRKYRCEVEQLNVYIDLISDVILSVTPKYEIEQVNAKERLCVDKVS